MADIIIYSSINDELTHSLRVRDHFNLLFV